MNGNYLLGVYLIFWLVNGTKEKQEWKSVWL